MTVDLLRERYHSTSRLGAAPDASGLLKNGDFQHLEQYFSGIQGRFRGGQASAEEPRKAFRSFYPTDRSLAPKYDAWVSKYPNSYVARVARGIYFKKIGYEERGSRYMSETSVASLRASNLAYGQVFELPASWF